MVNTNEEMFYTVFVAKKHLLYVYKMFTLLPIWKQYWLKHEWGSEVIFSYSLASNSRGVAIFISNNLDYKIHDKKSDDYGNWVALDIYIYQ